MKISLKYIYKGIFRNKHLARPTATSMKFGVYKITFYYDYLIAPDIRSILLPVEVFVRPRLDLK